MIMSVHCRSSGTGLLIEVKDTLRHLSPRFLVTIAPCCWFTEITDFFFLNVYFKCNFSLTIDLLTVY